MLKKLNTSRKISVFLYSGIFVVMFLCNWLTPYLVDDFTYRLSFATGEFLQSVWDIFPSLAAHAHSMNGRLTAHFFVQLFALMPNVIFDLCNAGVFCLLIWLISGYTSEKRNNLLTAAVFGAIWLYQPAFGQVNLWQDGSVNYLWSAVVVLAYLKPLTKLYMNGVLPFRSKFSKTGFLIFSFLAGSYSETASAAAVFISFLLVLLAAREQNRRINWYAAASTVLAAMGYISIYLAPAQWANKSAEMSISVLVLNFGIATVRYTSFGILAAAAMVLLVVNLSLNTSAKTIILGAVFIAGSLVANYIMVVAVYYSQRSTVGAFIFLLTALTIWLPPVLKERYWGTMAVSAMAVLILATLPAGLQGVRHIAISYSMVKQNEQLICESRDQGIMNVEIPWITSDSRYSALNELKYVDTEDCFTYPNDAMAVYYGVETIIGIEEEPANEP
jgi:hypothetical protein